MLGWEEGVPSSRSNETPSTASPDAAQIYCIVPGDLAPKLQDRLREHFRKDPRPRPRGRVRVIVEGRRRERRGEERRSGKGSHAGPERRRIRNRDGRRVADRRAIATPVKPPGLPRLKASLASRLVFVERLEPAAQSVEDADSTRLVTRAQGGDDAAFGLLYGRYLDRVYGYLRLTVRDRHEAQDITQEVFVEMLDAMPAYEIRVEQPIRVLLFRIAWCRAIDHLRKHQRSSVEAPDEIDRRRDAAPSDEGPPALDWISDDDLSLFVGRLPLIQRQSLLLRYVLGFSHEEIAGVLGQTSQAVRSQQHRALSQLRDRLTSVGRGSPSRSRTLKRAPMRIRLRGGRVLLERRFALRESNGPAGRRR